MIGGFFARIFCDAEETGEDADDVAIEEWLGLIEGDARDGAGGVASDALQGEDGIEIVREEAVVFITDFLRGLLHVADAGVIAESFPEFVDAFRRSFCERCDRGERLHPTFPIGDHRPDLGLLEHDFRNPDGVRIAGATPREVASAFGEPAEQGETNKVYLRG